jgi:DNA-binding NarL/FixJ family response regulator
MRILIADDHDLLRDTLTLYLEGSGGFETDSVSDFEDVMRRLDGREPFDVVLLDLNMPGMNGLDSLERAMTAADGYRVALMSGFATRDVAEQALEMGAAGFLPKTLPARSLVNAVRFMAMGEQYAPIEFLTAAEDTPPHPLSAKLSDREMQVLKGLTEGKSNKQIARDLDLREPTVKLHVKTLYRKVGATNRTQAALIAKEAGVF